MTDDDKLRQLAAAMERDGWCGPPVVVIERPDADPQAVTGSHRLAAAQLAGLDVPVVTLDDLLVEHGLGELLAEYEAAGLDTLHAAARAMAELPAATAERYGLDLH